MTDVQNDATQEANLEDSRLYEAAFHIVPNLDEAGAVAEAGEIKQFLVAQGATIMGSGEPMLMNLAYPIQKDIERKRHTFTRAHFGWFVFEATPEAAHTIKDMLGTRPTIVRSLLVKTMKEATTDRKHPALLATVDAEETPVVEDVVVADVVAPIVEEDKKPMDVEQVDAEIAKLVVE